MGVAVSGTGGAGRLMMMVVAMSEFKYDLEVDLGVASNHSLMVDMIGRNKRVLETGCATGYMSRVLVERGCRVVGVELDPVAARQAEQYCERVIVGNLDQLDLGEQLEPGSFDVVVFGDVLEHLRDPLRCLRQIRPLLAPDGYVVASVPNIAHGAVRLSLLRGDFEYQSLGLLDETHVHFFTRASMEEMLHQAGFVMARLERVTLGLFDTELKLTREDFSPEVVEQLSHDPEALTYQFVTKALQDNGTDVIRELQARDEERQKEVLRYRSHFEALEAERVALQTQCQALLEDRDAWLARTKASEREAGRLNARVSELERQVAENEPMLRQLRAEVDAARSERDLWRHQATRKLTSARNLVRAAKAVYRVLPEPGRKAARPALRRMHTAMGRPLAPGGSGGGESGDGAGEGSEHHREGSGNGAQPAGRVDAFVSVLIPTLNAGPEFARNLDQIRAQQGLRGVEIVVADSGSSDETVAIARSMGARVVEIPAAEFNHGATRNRLAELARGDVLLMTVQDARLVGRFAIRDLVRLLRADDSVVAVSARQIPRAGSDLFAAYLAVAHHRAMSEGRRPGPEVPWAEMTVAERRSACALDDVCAAIDRSAWEQLRFRPLAFAEDLDLAIRAAERGMRVIASDDVAVIHSHGRPAAYHLRRFAVDRVCVADLLGDTQMNPLAAAGIAPVAAAGRALAAEVAGVQHRVAAEGPQTGGRLPLGSFLEASARALREGGPPAPPEDELLALDQLLAGAGDEPADPEQVAGLRASLLACLDMASLVDFAAAHPEVPVIEAERFLAKFVAMAVGSVLGDALRADPSSELARTFTAGV